MFLKDNKNSHREYRNIKENVLKSKGKEETEDLTERFISDGALIFAEILIYQNCKAHVIAENSSRGKHKSPFISLIWFSFLFERK